MTSIIIACGSKKLSHPAKAKDIYVGSLFRGARRAAEATGLPWFIMSAKYGIIPPDQTIEPYDMTYGKTTGKKAWEISEQIQRLGMSRPIWALVPARYAQVLSAAVGSQEIRTPLRGLSMGNQTRMFKLIREAGSVEEGIRRSHVPNQ